METWRDLGSKNRTSANQLFAAGQWRSCASRAYYALYAELTHQLLQAKISMPTGRGNPKHANLSMLVGNNLIAVRPQSRWRLSGLVKKLYDLRIMADYLPNVDIAEPEARIAMGLMDQAFLCLKGKP